MRYIILIALICLLPTYLFSQDSVDVQEEYNNLAGFYYSKISGKGLSYQALISDNFALRFTGLAILKLDDYNKEYDKDINIGMEFQYSLSKGNKTRTYFFFAGSYWFLQEELTQFWISNDKISDNNTKWFDAGPGFGFEFRPFPGLIGSHLTLNMTMAYRFEYKLLTIYYTDNITDITKKLNTNIIFGGGLSYAF